MIKFDIPQKAPVALMSHLVAGYPTAEAALSVASALVSGGAAILEVQLPFSDPSADGPAIQGACANVLLQGFTTADGFAFIKKIHEKFPHVPILIMTYASLVFTPGIQKFCALAKEAGASGLIVPDLPFDCDEGLTAACTENGLANIPVAAPSMSKERLSKLANAGFDYIYAALRAGITGTETLIGQQTLTFLSDVSAGGASVFGGFGISSREQAQTLLPHVAAVVAGSVFVRIVADKIAAGEGTESIAADIEKKAKEISGL